MLIFDIRPLIQVDNVPTYLDNITTIVEDSFYVLCVDGTSEKKVSVSTRLVVEFYYKNSKSQKKLTWNVDNCNNGLHSLRIFKFMFLGFDQKLLVVVLEIRKWDNICDYISWFLKISNILK